MQRKLNQLQGRDRMAADLERKPDSQGAAGALKGELRIRVALEC